MIVHLYTFCWNESLIIPFFLQHYQDSIDKIIVYDNESNDNSAELLKDKVTIKSFNTNGKNALSIITPLRNSIWKESKGQADWVIVLDMDEFLYHLDGLRSVLNYADSKGFTIIKPENAFEMMARELPDPKFPITAQVKHGYSRVPGFDKPCVFKPDAIQESNISHGGHRASPTGDVKLGIVPGFWLLHYKQLSLDLHIARTKLLAARVPSEELARGMNGHYFSSVDKLKDEFEGFFKLTSEILP